MIKQDMKISNKDEYKRIFVTVGFRFSNIPMQNKVGLVIYPGESEIKAAKELRKRCADNPSMYRGYAREQKPFKPSELYWAIFDNVDDEKPMIHSENWHEGILVSVHSYVVTFSDLQ